ncbi:MAG: large conductance mechanosensitive channel protein MscL [Brumimicrobium sp.]
MLKEFREFLMRGNVVDLAVAVVIGGAFGAIITSFVDDIITPAILNPALKAANVENIAELTWGAVRYGSFLSAIISFVIIGFSLFLIIKAMAKLQNLKRKREEEEAAAEEPAGPSQEDLLTEIRDELKRLNAK